MFERWMRVLNFFFFEKNWSKYETSNNIIDREENDIRIRDEYNRIE